MLFTWSPYLCRQRPTLPHTFACSTIGPARLNFRVRDGNGCDSRGMLTGKLVMALGGRFPAADPMYTRAGSPGLRMANWRHTTKERIALGLATTRPVESL